ncbi:STAS domain-containing protein [Nonomuraea roseoviolacea subsp. roseoviolacea]|uniref:STAS domain-containing protein n=1 Tax=Nonomuraea roseoviolacea TaxID=103837 RepID=UPI0031D71FFF
MSGFAPEPLELALETPEPGTLRVALRGDLDHTTADELLDAVHAALAVADPPREVRLDAAELRLCDSRGLSALLLVRRRADETGARLRLDNRGPALQRLLDVTGTLDHLTGEPAPGRPAGESAAGHGGPA